MLRRSSAAASIISGHATDVGSGRAAAGKILQVAPRPAGLITKEGRKAEQGRKGKGMETNGSRERKRERRSMETMLHNGPSSLSPSGATSRECSHKMSGPICKKRRGRRGRGGGSVAAAAAAAAAAAGRHGTVWYAGVHKNKRKCGSQKDCQGRRKGTESGLGRKP